MRSAAVLALLLCAGQVVALPVNSPMNKGDTEVMKCIVEVISDTLSKPSPMPVSKECLETLRGDERILSILRHQNLLKELQDLALQGAKERTHQQKKHSSYEDELSEVLEKPNDQAEPKEGTEEVSSKDAAEKRDDSKEVEKSDEDSDGDRPQASPELGLGSKVEEDSQAPGEEEEEAPFNAHPLASLPSPKHPGPQAKEDSEGPSQGPASREKGLSAEQGRQAEKEEEEQKREEAEAGEKAVPEEESSPTAALKPRPSLGGKETQRAAPGWPEALAMDGAGKMGAEKAKPREGKGERAHSQQEEEEMAGAPQGLFHGGKSGEPEQEEQLSKEWEDAKRWSKMDQLAKELTAEKRLEGEEEEEEDPDRSMRLSFQARGYGFRGPGLQLRRGWRPTSREDSVEAGLPLQVRGYPEEKKEEEGSANRRPEDQELESLSAIKAELEKVAYQLQELRRG
ncbi:chromogranin-A [Moschus berezovskii]|uniref:chromogranin-A n=1 Tax=Moschus berezovskii TaxID=68408 RepID=UPI002444AB17|nr:chromogranin-A [Moschus berezovskii]